MKNAYITLLSTNNYIYGCIGLMYSWKKTNPKYPFYCVVTENITEENIRILTEIGYHVLREPLYIPKSYWTILKSYEETGNYATPIGYSTADLTKNGWQYGWSKLHIFKYTQFDKLLYIDSDTYVVQNIDYLFDYPEWSSVCEWENPKYGSFRLHSGFMLIHPDEKTYNDLLQLAEDNPLIIHPSVNEYQLSNDYDLINLYLGKWNEDIGYCLPPCTFFDSLRFNTDEENIPILLNSFQQLKIIHLSDTKPWIGGTSHVANFGGTWSLWKELYLLYIRFLNAALQDMYYKNIAALPYIQ